MSTDVSFVIPSHNEGPNLRKTIESLQTSTTDCSYEIIVIDNGSRDGSSDFLSQMDRGAALRLIKTDHRLGVAKSRNMGADLVSGEVLVFVDAHVLFQPGWIGPLLEVLKRESVGVAAPGVSAWGNAGSKGYGMQWRNARLDIEWLSKKSNDPYPVPLVPGLCMALRTDFFRQIGGFDPGMVNWGSEDLEICLRSWLLGYEVLIIPSIEVSHLFRSRHGYQVDWTDVLCNLLRTVFLHFNQARTDRVIASVRSFPGFSSAFRQVNDSDIWERRRDLDRKRRYDDNWFFGKFALKF
jgi:GT2 family glycosyltransferase